MAFTSVVLTGTVLTPSGAPLVGASVGLTLSQAITDGVSVVTPQALTTLTGSAGNIQCDSICQR